MGRLLGLLLVLLFLGGVYTYWATRDLPSVASILKEGINPATGTQVYAADGSVILSAGKFRHKTVKLIEVSPHFIDALLATEDRRFYEHRGVDPIALGRALVRDITHRKLLEGGSTLTQQLARNVFLSNERSLKRKVREAVLAIKLEQELSKEQILELYVNNIYFGEGAYGIQAASEIYFNKRPSQLTIDEAAMLAGMPQAPSLYSPFQNPERAKERRNEVLANMVEAGKLQPEKLETYENRSFHLNTSGQELASGDRAPFFNRYVLNQVQKQFDLDEQSFWQSGLKIYTTLDLQAQSLAAREVKNQSVAYGRTGKRQQAALLSINPKTGAILAYVGGKSYSVSQFDRVSQALRSPGSLFKVFTYTTAIDMGYEPKRVYLDSPIQFGEWAPKNYDGGHHGYMSIARALTQSNNVIAVKVLKEIGPQAVINMASKMGLHANLENNLALTLGGSGVTLMDITSAFGVLANQGVRAEPYAVDKIVDSEGNLIYQHQPLKTEVLNRTTVDTMVSMMMGVIQFGTGKGADIGRPVAGKTGTSDDNRDAWFIGYTPDVITGVWVGNDDNSPMPGMTGGALPAVIWRTFMRAYLANRLITNFDLAYCKPMTNDDFMNYDIKNLSQGETLDPNAVQTGDSTAADPNDPVTTEGTEGTDPTQPDAAPLPPPVEENNSPDLPSLEAPPKPQPIEPKGPPTDSPILGRTPVVPIKSIKRNGDIIPLPPQTPSTSVPSTPSRATSPQ